MSGKDGRRCVYVAGPMTGLPEFNFPAFKAAAEELRAEGLEVRSPTEISDDAAPDSYTSAKPYAYYLRLSLRMLLECDAVVLLPGWDGSRGACLEKAIAEHLGMSISEWPAGGVA
jgi:hypothetical protein